MLTPARYQSLQAGLLLVAGVGAAGLLLLRLKKGVGPRRRRRNSLRQPWQQLTPASFCWLCWGRKCWARWPQGWPAGTPGLLVLTISGYGAYRLRHETVGMRAIIQAGACEYAVFCRGRGTAPPPALAARVPAYADAYIYVWKLSALPPAQ